MNGVFCDSCKRWFPGEAGTQHTCMATLDHGATVVLVNEDCRWCKRSSVKGHPAGVWSTKWRCTSCGGWQDDEYAPHDLQIEEA